MEFKRNRNSVYNIVYHVVWCVKHHKPLLAEKVTERLKSMTARIYPSSDSEGVRFFADKPVRIINLKKWSLKPAILN